MAKMLDIRSVQLRITGEDEDTAVGGMLALVALVGMARAILQRPKAGDDRKNDGNPPWFSYGTFQFEFDREAVAAYKATKRSRASKTSAVPVAQPKTRKASTRAPARPKATTGKTTRLKTPKPATGKTTKLQPARPARKSGR